VLAIANRRKWHMAHSGEHYHLMLIPDEAALEVPLHALFAVPRKGAKPPAPLPAGRRPKVT
jgi:hypothetical protein